MNRENEQKQMENHMYAFTKIKKVNLILRLLNPLRNEAKQKA